LWFLSVSQYSQRNIYDAVMLLIEKIGDYYYDASNKPYKAALSATWYDNNPELIKRLKENIDNYYNTQIKDWG
jgi:hypothetical protein